MNRDKGFLRLAFVLTPVFGVLGLILNKILSVAYSPDSLGYIGAVGIHQHTRW